jgi:hypothetical protein
VALAPLYQKKESRTWSEPGLIYPVGIYFPFLREAVRRWASHFGPLFASSIPFVSAFNVNVFALLPAGWIKQFMCRFMPGNVF